MAKQRLGGVPPLRADELLDALKHIPYVYKKMKEAEVFQKVKLEEALFIFRADGVRFGKYFKEAGTPRDEEIHNALVKATEELLRTYSCEEAYVSSDEVSVLCSHLLYGGRVEKIVSTFASLLGAYFSRESWNNG
jgi:tRNA(His) 5'-end guanylyltransferase